MGNTPSKDPGTVQPGEQMHEEDGLAKQVGQQNGQPDLSMVLQPVKYCSRGQKQTAQNLA